MYGSLATLVLIMLWMYSCMYCVLLGGNLNRVLKEKKEGEADKENEPAGEKVS